MYHSRFAHAEYVRAAPKALSRYFKGMRVLGNYKGRGKWSRGRIVDKEARNTPFCVSQEKFHTVVSPGVRNTSEAP